MGAAVALDGPVGLDRLVGHDGRGGRGRDAVQRARSGAPRTTGPRRRHLTIVPAAQSAPPPTLALRLTRVGRLAVTLTVGCVMALAVAVLLVGPGAAAGGPGIEREIAVLPGQTLSQIAADQLPGLSIRQGIAQLVLANNLPSVQITAGQHLLIPAVP